MAVRKKAAVKKKQAAKKAMKKTVKKTAARPAGKTVKKTAKKAAPRKKSKTAKGTGPATPAIMSKRKEMMRKLLLKKRNEVVQGLEAQMGRKLMHDAGQKIDSAMDSADQSMQDVDQGIDYSIIEMKYEQYKDIADAFRKLQNDTYGICEECGQDIDIKRLGVNPFARYCIECKTRKEEMEKIQREETRFKE